MNIENIEGITVLGSRIVENPAYIIIVVGIVCSIVLLVLGIILTKGSIDDKYIGLSIVSGIVTLATLAFLIFCSVKAIILPKHQECLDIYIENAEVMQYVYDRYEIIEANGNVYTIMEKAE